MCGRSRNFVRENKETYLVDRICSLTSYGVGSFACVEKRLISRKHLVFEQERFCVGSADRIYLRQISRRFASVLNRFLMLTDFVLVYQFFFQI